MDIRREIGHFIGASIVIAPITFGLVWLLYWMFKGSSMAHPYKMILSCGIVSVGLIFLSFTGGDTISYNQQLWIFIWFVIGLFWWKPKPKS